MDPSSVGITAIAVISDQLSPNRAFTWGTTSLIQRFLRYSWVHNIFADSFKNARRALLRHEMLLNAIPQYQKFVHPSVRAFPAKYSGEIDVT